MLSPKPILDTNVLRHFSFAHPRGLDILLIGVGSPRAYFPAEVYNRDERRLPLEQQADEELSELARGLRGAWRLVARGPAEHVIRYQTWLDHSRQLMDHIERGSLMVDPITLEELAQRVAIEQRFGIAKGEAACLVLALRHGGIAVFTSTDKAALRAAENLGVSILSGPAILRSWIETFHPGRGELDDLLSGLADAKYRLREIEVKQLTELLKQ